MDLRNGQLETQSSNSATECEYDGIGGITLEQSWKENSSELSSGTDSSGGNKHVSGFSHTCVENST